MNGRRTPGGFIRLDDKTTWLDPFSARIEELRWKMRYAGTSLSEVDKLTAASILDAYCYLVAKPQKRRNQICAALKAIGDSPPAPPPDGRTGA